MVALRSSIPGRSDAGQVAATLPLTRLDSPILQTPVCDGLAAERTQSHMVPLSCPYLAGENVRGLLRWSGRIWVWGIGSAIGSSRCEERCRWRGERFRFDICALTSPRGWESVAHLHAHLVYALRRISALPRFSIVTGRVREYHYLYISTRSGPGRRASAATSKLHSSDFLGGFSV